jgi:hypothetical protein
MLAYRLRNMLLEALASGPPYQVSTNQVIPAATYLKLLKELERRGLVTSGPNPVLTEAGIAEAKWFAGIPNQCEDGKADESPTDQAWGKLQ